MRKFLVAFSALLISSVALANDPGNIEERFIQLFESTFPNAQQVSWQNMPQAYVVSFYESNLLHRVMYFKNGSSTELIRYYEKQLLPLSLHEKVKKEFPGKNIFGVVETSVMPEIDPAGNDITYYLVLEDSKFWTTVKVTSDGEMKKVNRLRKAH